MVSIKPHAKAPAARSNVTKSLASRAVWYHGDGTISINDGVIVAEPGAAVDLSAIEVSAGAALARFKHPRKYVLLEELPRNTMGKVQKNVLRDAYADATP